MYESYFGLKDRPFPAVVQTERYFPATVIEGARQTLIRCLQRGEGAGVIIGPSGTGKTLLCQMLAKEFENAFRVVFLTRGFNSRRAMLQTILYELGQTYRGLDEGELRLALADHVTLSSDCPQGILLLIDEAHSLPVRLLDEIRTLTNLTAGGQPRVRVVLAGSSALEERLANPKLESFNQRIAARCYLESLSGPETEQYIRSHLSVAGAAGEPVFSGEACKAVQRATEGIPRLINQLCDHAMLLAFAATQRVLNAACVEEAWADLQQLPSPWETRQDGAHTNTPVIEFGGLDDTPDADEEDPASPSMASESPSTVPMLRVRSLDDEPVVEPLEQLQQIENALTDLDDPVQVAEAIGPELDLVVPDPGNPFSEPFEEEEPVVETAWLPAQYTTPIQEPPMGTKLPSYCVDAAVQAVVESSTIAARSSGPTGSVNMASIGNEPTEQTGGAEPQTVLMRPEAAGVFSLPDDSDMIIVEDDSDDVAPAPARPVAPVAKHDFRHLFAKLRQG